MVNNCKIQLFTEGTTVRAAQENAEALCLVERHGQTYLVRIIFMSCLKTHITLNLSHAVSQASDQVKARQKRLFIPTGPSGILERR
jgi:hypothetical protein